MLKVHTSLLEAWGSLKKLKNPPDDYSEGRRHLDNLARGTRRGLLGQAEISVNLFNALQNISQDCFHVFSRYFSWTSPGFFPKVLPDVYRYFYQHSNNSFWVSSLRTFQDSWIPNFAWSYPRIFNWYCHRIFLRFLPGILLEWFPTITLGVSLNISLWILPKISSIVYTWVFSAVSPSIFPWVVHEFSAVVILPRFLTEVFSVLLRESLTLLNTFL